MTEARAMVYRDDTVDRGSLVIQQRLNVDI